MSLSERIQMEMSGRPAEQKAVIVDELLMSPEAAAMAIGHGRPKTGKKHIVLVSVGVEQTLDCVARALSAETGKSAGRSAAARYILGIGLNALTNHWETTGRWPL